MNATQTIMTEEAGYLNLLDYILKNGSERKDRTGVGTIGVFGTQLRFSLENNKIPMLTTKKMFARGVIEELLFFLRGETNTKILEDKGVNIWKGNTSREFLDKRGLNYLPEGNMGKGYGFQWRNFGKTNLDLYKQSSLVESNDNCGEFTIKGIDQLSQVINTLKTNPDDRRIIMSAWNPQQLKDMALAPCHILAQFYAINNKLSCQFYQRSVDSFLGLPFNILSYALLTHIIAKTVKMVPTEVIFVGGDTHIYKNHIDQVKLQLTRDPYEFPKLKINKELNDIKDIESLSFEDFEISEYKSYATIKAPMAV